MVISVRKPGNGFQFVQRAAGVSKGAPRNHRHDDTSSRGQRCNDQAGFVAHSAGRVLIHLDTVDAGKIYSSPERIMHSVREVTSRSVMPAKNTAMRNADIW